MSKDIQTITVLGAGYVGLTTASLLAHCGYTVYVVEPNPERLRVIKSGKSFFFEEGLDEVIGMAMQSGTLIPTDSYAESVAKSDIVFSCVGTPDNPDGSSNLRYVFAAANETVKHAKPGTVYVQKSTVPVGTGRKIQDIFAAANANITYTSNPEFLREGTAIYDTLFFDRVVVGGDDKSAISTVMDIYITLEEYREHLAHIARIQPSTHSGQYIATTLNSAELIKVTSNAFLALKISFANSIAMLADQTDADIVEVMDAVGADKRIGRSFLNAGRGYGGGCFPKDVSGLIMSGLEHGVDLDILKAAQDINNFMPSYIVDKLQDALPDESLKGKRIAVLGLAFKAGTSDVRRSPGVAIANKLVQAHAETIAYDPEAAKEAAEDLSEDVKQVSSLEMAIKDADAVVIATEWGQFLKYPAVSFARSMRGKYIIDAVNQYSAVEAAEAGLTYIGVGHAI